MASSLNRVLVYGGKGALGAVCVKYFKSQNWWVGAIDFAQNDEADINILVKPNDLWTDQSQQVTSDVEQALKGEKVDAVICVAGGWAGGNAESKDFIKNSDLMWKQSVWTSAIAAHLSTKFLKENGFLSLTGAKAALESTSGMIGYGFAKAAVHHLVSSLADNKSGLPNGSVVAAVLPITLDTPMNRKWMPKADHSSWTPLETVAELFFKWAAGKNRPKTGSLIQLITKDGQTEFVPA